MTVDLDQLSDNVLQLTERGKHIEPIREWTVTYNPTTGRESTNDQLQWHKTSQPSLLTALRATIFDQAQTAAMTGPARTVPHLNLAAIDRLATITADARLRAATADVDVGARLVDQLNAIGDRLGGLFVRNMRPGGVERAMANLTQVATILPTMAEWDIRSMPGIASTSDVSLQRDICIDVARWWTWCRIFAGWTTPTWRPNARCPAEVYRNGERTICDALPGVVDEVPHGLRIRLEKGNQAAVCMTCNTTWGMPPLPPLEQLARAIEAAGESERIADLVHTPDAGPRNRGGRS